MLKNYQPFFINIGNYQVILVQTRQLFAHFRPAKYWSRDRAPSNSICIKQCFSTGLPYTQMYMKSKPRYTTEKGYKNGVRLQFGLLSLTQLNVIAKN